MRRVLYYPDVFACFSRNLKYKYININKSAKIRRFRVFSSESLTNMLFKVTMVHIVLSNEELYSKYIIYKFEEDYFFRE